MISDARTLKPEEMIWLFHHYWLLFSKTKGLMLWFDCKPFKDAKP